MFIGLLIGLLPFLPLLAIIVYSAFSKAACPACGVVASESSSDAKNLPANRFLESWVEKPSACGCSGSSDGKNSVGWAPLNGRKLENAAVFSMMALAALALILAIVVRF